MWSVSLVVICCVVFVVFLTLAVSVFAFTAAVNVGRSDLDRCRSTVVGSHQDSGQVQRQSTPDIPLVLSVGKQYAMDQGMAAQQVDMSYIGHTAV